MSARHPRHHHQEFRVRAWRLAGEADPRHGYFGPGSAMWRVNREWVMQVGAVRAVHLQLAHPKVAQGVADYSSFQQAFLRRALHTSQAATNLVFGNRDTATRQALRLHAMHARVRGRLTGPASDTGDATYAALDQRLLTWVYATLIDTTILTHDAFLGTMGPDDWEPYYQESKILAELLGIDSEGLPATLAGFRRWMKETLAGDEITVTPTARAVARLFRRGAWFLRPLQPVHVALATATLPPRLREEFGLPDHGSFHRLYAGAAAVSRLVLPRLPGALRTTPAVWSAERR